MITDEILQDIMSAGDRCILIFLGDSYQLPPIGTDHDFLKYADVSLTEVMRHDSAILYLATRVRTMKRIVLPSNVTKDITTYKANEITYFLREYEKCKGDCILICFTNKFRVQTNKLARRLLGRKELLVPGDSIISISNSKHLVNGESAIVETVDGPNGKEQIEIVENGTKVIKHTYYRYTLTLKGYGDGKIKVPAFLFPDTLRPTIYNRQIPELDGIDGINHAVAVITYGYAISGHKSQGSQWHSVFVNQDFLMKKIDIARWYYTAITRAQKKLFINTRPYR